MIDTNQEPKIPTEQMLVGIFVGSQGMRINSPLPPRELLKILVAITEDVRESVIRSPQSPIVSSPAVPGLHRG